MPQRGNRASSDSVRGRVTFRDLSVASGLPLARVRGLRRGEGLGDAGKLAAALGVTASTVRRWKKSGVPVKRIAQVGNLLTDREAALKADRVERQRVRKIVSKARSAGVIPKGKPAGTTRFGGQRAVGVRTIWHLNRYLDVEALNIIEELTMAAPRGPRYIVTVSAVEAGITGKVRGYRGKFTKSLGKKAENIAFASAITSGTHTSRRAAIWTLFSKLQGAIDDSDSLIFLTDLLVFSYQYKETERAKMILRREGRIPESKRGKR